MELLDIYDVHRRFTGRTVLRDAPIQKGDWLLIVHVCVFNQNGQILIQKRADSKDRYPGCWDLSAGGFAKSGENSVQAAIRELKEELGIALTADRLIFAHSEPFICVHDDIFILYTDISADSIIFQREEISAVKWADWNEVKTMLLNGTFVDYDIKLIDNIFKNAIKEM